MSSYCVYLTVYSGNKMPKFYLGSSSLQKVSNGYRGSVSSKEYGKIWHQELKDNPALFKTIIISEHFTRAEAFDHEEYLQKARKVVTNPLYINRSYANSKFSLKQHSPWTRLKFKEREPWNKGKTGIYTSETLEKMSNAMKGRVGKPHSEKTRIKLRGPNPKKALFGERNGMFGKTHRESTKEFLSSLPAKHLKGKTYEEIYGSKRAEELKQDRSEKLKQYIAAHPESRSGSGNANAKRYRFTSPTGEVFVIAGALKKFCIKHGLDCGSIINVLKGRRDEYKGWKAEYAD